MVQLVQCFSAVTSQYLTFGSMSEIDHSTCDICQIDPKDPLPDVQCLYYLFNVPTVAAEETKKPSWPLVFYREYVSKNLPVLIKGGASHFPAVQKWNAEYFKNTMPDKQVTVTLTPNGYADGVANFGGKEYFFLPEEKQMFFSDFLEILEDKTANYVSYIQEQNSNLTEKFPELMNDVEKEIQWASTAYNLSPDAVNFWMGDERAVTSMHKDPYENIYCVIDGYKDFTIIPPLDLPMVPYKNYQMRQYKNVTPESFEVEEIPKEIYWVAADPLDESLAETYPEFYTSTRKYEVRVEKGDILYLPSLWFHHVRQSHKCVAVNYWYDIEYSDPKFCYYRMLACLCGKEEYT